MSKGQYPQCKNKKDGNLVCLHPQCQKYPFFCTVCESEQCQSQHFHGDRLNSISYKQFIKRILKDRKPSQQLENALNKYNECLQKLKKVVQEFIKKQLLQIEEIRKKSVQIGQQEQKIIIKLRKKQFKGIQGNQLDKLWSSVTKLFQKKRDQQTIQFLQLKKEEVNQISQNFQIVNNMELQIQGQKIQKNDKKIQEKQNKKIINNDNVKLNDHKIQ